MTDPEERETPELATTVVDDEVAAEAVAELDLTAEPETVTIADAEVTTEVAITLALPDVEAATATAPATPEAPAAPPDVWPVMYDGAGLAWDSSFSRPVPQAMAEPSGWVAFGAPTISPAALSIAQRVVQTRLLGSAACENW